MNEIVMLPLTFTGLVAFFATVAVLVYTCVVVGVVYFGEGEE